jgi:sugar fermentation stimulation protein A
MNNEKKIQHVTILNRYKRFLADVQLETGEQITVHTANTGSMRSCWSKGWPAIISDSENVTRKYRYSLEMCYNGDTWIGVNTSLPNALVAYSIEHRLLSEFLGYKRIKREVPYGKNSRIDVFLEDDVLQSCYIEIKNVTLKEENDSAAYFPDAVSERALKHVAELIDMAAQGFRAVLFFVVQREDVDCFKAAAHIHPAYAEALREANAKGVELLAYRCSMQPNDISLETKLPIIF